MAQVLEVWSLITGEYRAHFAKNLFVSFYGFCGDLMFGCAL